MKVLILCGGKGTRLREETSYRPKPMVEIGGRPILWHIMKMYAHYGHKDFVLCAGYKADVIKEYFLNYQAMQKDFTIDLGSQNRIQFHGNHPEEDWTVTLADTGLHTQTAERIYKARQYVGDGPFMVTYGDGVTDLELKALVAFHCKKGRLATLTGVRAISRFGVVEANADMRVVGFKEKPQVKERINAGFFIFEPDAMAYFEGQTGMLEDGPLPALCEAGQLSIFPHDGFWQCMDTYRDFTQLNSQWDEERAPWAVWAD